jgi:hypothetical protein
MNELHGIDMRDDNIRYVVNIFLEHK